MTRPTYAQLSLPASFRGTIWGPADVRHYGSESEATEREICVRVYRASWQELGGSTGTIPAYPSDRSVGKVHRDLSYAIGPIAATFAPLVGCSVWNCVLCFVRPALRKVQIERSDTNYILLPIHTAPDPK